MQYIIIIQYKIVEIPIDNTYDKALEIPIIMSSNSAPLITRCIVAYSMILRSGGLLGGNIE